MDGESWLTLRTEEKLVKEKSQKQRFKNRMPTPENFLDCW